MARCLQLAENGLGSTYPNPLVGCVIVHEGRIIGEGWHRKAGEAHAEVNAIESVADRSLLGDSQLYVNLEPCSHHGRTPPCADLIVKHRIPRVFIGTRDDNDLVSGRGIQRLRDNGCEVTVGLLEDSCRRLNRRFFTFHSKRRPYVILKWAESSDGFLFPSEARSKGPVWISNAFSRQLVHKWRTQEQAILVGTRTVIQDDPSLTARGVKGEPILRLVIDREGRLGRDLKVFRGPDPTWVFGDVDRISGMTATNFGAHVNLVGLDFDKDLIPQILSSLWESGVQSLIVEGGAYTLNAFVNSGLWDEARVFVGKPVFGEGLRAPRLDLPRVSEERIAGDQLLWVENVAASSSSHSR